MTRECVFCSLLNGTRSADWVWRGPSASALLPLRHGWLAPGHTLVISNEHAVGVQDVSSDCLQEVALLVQRVAQQMAAAIGALGVNVLNASGPNSDQSVDHLHFHVVPRWADDGLDTWVHGRSSHELAAGWLDDLRAGLSSTASGPGRGLPRSRILRDMTGKVINRRSGVSDHCHGGYGLQDCLSVC